MRLDATALGGLATAVLAGSVAAAVPGETQEALRPLLSCRGETDAAARLACYDRAAGALDTASKRRDIIVVDKAEVQKARRSLFGFSVPSLKLFGGGDDDKNGKRQPGGLDPEQDQITTKIRSARQDADGYWIIVMEDGAVWHQTSGALALSPRSGGEVTIKRAALGSYFMRVGRQPGVKARREG